MSSINNINSSSSLSASQQQAIIAQEAEAINAANAEAAEVNESQTSVVTPTASSVSSNSTYWAGQEDISSIALKAGAQSPSQPTQVQSTAFSQLSNNVVNPQTLPSPMDIVGQSTKTTPPTSSHPAI